jgi:NTE family protein
MKLVSEPSRHNPSQQFMMHRKSLAILLFSAALCSIGATNVAAQEKINSGNSSADRPKIGLVLSGGGARGMAHIGVLEWLEEHRIPIDYVAGTSMGGVVGGLYATGMTSTRMRHLVATLDWDKLLSGPPSYDELSFRRKEDRRAYPTTFEFGLRGGLRLPRGLNPGHYVGLTFDRLTLPYSTVRNFDDLPIPFRCVATDMIAAEPVVLKDGSLTQALRATMAIPGTFTPTEIDGRVLADGGLLDNIPSDVVKEMGADLIIAVNVGTPLGTRETIETLPGLLTQVIGVTTIENERRGLRLADIVVTPDLARYTSFDFEAGAEIVDLGYKGAAVHSAELRRLSLDDAAWQEHLAARNARRRTTIPVPIGIAVTGVPEERAEEIRHKLNENAGRPVNPDRLDRQLNDIRGGGRYESLGYDIVQLEGEPWLRIRVREKTYGPPFIVPLVQLQSRAAADVTFSAGFRLTNYDLGGRNSEVRLDAIIGSNNLLAVEYYRPLRQTGFFVAPRAFYSSDRTDLYQDAIRVAQYLMRQAAMGADVGYIFGRNSQLRAGYQLGTQNAQVSIGSSSLLPNVEGTLSAASVRFVYDGQNNVVVPTRGVRTTANAFWYLKSPGASEAYPQAEAGASGFHSAGKKGALFAYGSGGTTFNRTPGPVQQFTLGGPLRLSAYGLAQFRGSNYGFVAAGFRRRLGALPTLLGGKVYAAAWYECGSAFFRRSDVQYRDDVAGAFVMETLLGPLTFGGAWGRGTGKIFFSLGRFFWGQHQAGSQLEASYP